jgi:hypothetical protein
MGHITNPSLCFVTLICGLVMMWTTCLILYHIRKLANSFTKCSSVSIVQIRSEKNFSNSIHFSVNIHTPFIAPSLPGFTLLIDACISILCDWDFWEISNTFLFFQIHSYSFKYIPILSKIPMWFHPDLRNYITRKFKSL